MDDSTGGGAAPRVAAMIWGGALVSAAALGVILFLSGAHRGPASYLGALLIVFSAGALLHLALARRYAPRDSASEQRFRDFCEVASDWVWEIDDHARIVYVSDRIAEFTGLVPPEVEGKSLREVGLRPADGDGVAEHLEQLRRREPFSKVLYEWSTASGRRLLEVSGRPCRDPAGRPLGYRGTASDVTARLEAERARARAEERSERAHGAGTALLANMSHELRTPLSGILGMSQVLLETELSPHQRECTDAIEKSAAGLLTIVNDILDFSKIADSKPRVERIPFDLRATAEDVVVLLGPQARAKSIELHLRHPPDVPRHLVGDPNRIRQILVNLVANGIKFTRAGHVLVAIDGVADTERGARMTITVEDTGIGFSKHEATRIFKPFAQADASISHRFGGTGLGLAISRRLAELMEGSLEARSAPGRGSVFTLRLSLGVDARAALRGRPSRRLVGKRVLCVGGSQLGRAILLEELEALDVQARGASDTREARALLEAAQPRFDVVLAELGEAEDPAAARTQLRACLGDRAVPLVPVSGLTAAEKPGEIVVLRPVRQAQLAGALERALGTDIEPARAAEGIARPPEAVERTETPGQRRILVAEDNPVNQKVTAGSLGRLGCTIEMASNGQEALDRFAVGTFDLVLMDCQMPVMDGYEAARRIRALEGPGKRTPIVAVTAHANPGDRERCLASGMDDYLSKPLRIEALRAAVTRWLAGSADANAAGRPAAPRSGGAASRSGPAAPAQLELGPDDGLDTEKLAKLRQVVGHAGLTEIVDAFLSDAEGLLAGLRGAAAACDPGRVRALAHQLKSSSGSVGATRLSRTMRLVESIGAEASDDRWGELAPLLDQATESFAAVRGALAERARAA